MGEITLSKELTQGTTQTDRSPNTNKAHGPHHNPITSTTRQTTILSRPRANLCLARRGGGDATWQTPAPLEGTSPLEWISASFEGLGPSGKSPPRPRVQPLEQVSASLEASPWPATPHLLPRPEH
jgi:hypothetical protein